METQSITEMTESLPKGQQKAVKAIVMQQSGNELEWTWGSRERSMEMQAVLIFTRLNKKMVEAVKEFNHSINKIGRD